MGAVRIEFDSTLDDYVDAQILSLRQSGRFRRGMVYNALVGALLAGFLMYVVIPDVVLIRAVFGTGAGVVAALILSLSYRRTLRRNLTNISKDLRGTDGPIRTAVTMDEARIDMEWGGITVSCAWPSVRIIDQSPDAIEIVSDSIVSMRIPNRVFSDDAARSSFVGQARAYREAAGGRWSRFGHRVCPQCGYDVYGLPDESCSECGEQIPTGTRSPV
jgi:ribosomal protein L37E